MLAGRRPPSSSQKPIRSPPSPRHLEFLFFSSSRVAWPSLDSPSSTSPPWADAVHDSVSSRTRQPQPGRQGKAAQFLISFQFRLVLHYLQVGRSSDHPTFGTFSVRPGITLPPGRTVLEPPFFFHCLHWLVQWDEEEKSCGAGVGRAVWRWMPVVGEVRCWLERLGCGTEQTGDGVEGKMDHHEPVFSALLSSSS